MPKATKDLNASLEIRGGHQGGPEPWAQTATLTIDVSGFHDADGIGRAGDQPAMLDIASTKEKLLAEFDRAELVALLDHLVRLRNAL